VQQGLLFVNKKKQKNFDSHHVPPPVGHTREVEQTFFGYFFSKK